MISWGKTSGRFGMDKKGFSQIRNHLGKTQSQMAQLPDTSLKPVQNFEQGWRNIPLHIERSSGEKPICNDQDFHGWLTIPPLSFSVSKTSMG
jgi:hypothetical protein